MPLGGGTWITQNKILPGAYINVISMARAIPTLSDRGVATIPYKGDWGALGEVVEVSSADMQRDSMKIFGFDYTNDVLKPMREIFKNSITCYFYRLGTGGAKAANTFATAKHVGIRGNNLSITVSANVDNPANYDVTLMFSGFTVDSQTVASSADLQDNEFVTYIKTATLSAALNVPFTGGTNPTVQNADYQNYLNAIEPYSFNAIGCPSNDTAIKSLFTAFTKRMRDEQGVKFQCVTYDNPADFEGVINVLNKVTDAGADEFSLIYWVTGTAAGTAVNRSALNKIYDGEYTIDVNYTQSQLITAIKSGQFTFHRVATNIRVLADINSLVTTTLEKGDIFKENQTIRVIDQIANDIAYVFNTKYIGQVPNDNAGRISFWSDIVQHHMQLQDIRAIEGFTDSDVKVAQGNTKRAVVVSDAVSVVNAMAQLYMNVYVS